MAAFNGGFVVRAGGKFYFYDNAGVLQGEPVDQNATSGEPFDTGRGDGTRIAGHVNSSYIYLVGKVQNAAMVRVAVWDATTRTFVAKADVSEGSSAATSTAPPWRSMPSTASWGPGLRSPMGTSSSRWLPG